MVGCFSIGLFLIFVPYERLILWFCRITAWLLFSPAMKIFDYFYVMKYFPAVDKETNELEVPTLNFEHFFKSPYYQKLAKKMKIAEEDGLKLKEMREYRFGDYTEEVPFIDFSLNPCIPLPTSSARPYCEQSRRKGGVPGKNTTKGNNEKGNRTSNDNFGYEYLPREELKWQTFSGQQLNGKMIPHTHSDVSRS